MRRDVCALCEAALAGNEVGMAGPRPEQTSEYVGVSHWSRDIPGVFRAVFAKKLLGKFSGARAEVEAARAYDRKAREDAAARGVTPYTNFESEDSEAMGSARVEAARQREETRTLEARQQRPHKWSFFRGVGWVHQGGEYLLNFRRNGMRERLGRFLEERDVALAFDQLARQENEKLGEIETKWTTNFVDKEGTVRAPPQCTQGSRYFRVAQQSRSTLWKVEVKGSDGKMLAAGPPWALEAWRGAATASYTTVRTVLKRPD
eukprot:gene25052-30564_t